MIAPEFDTSGQNPGEFAASSSSRRHFLRSGAGLVAGGAAAQMLPGAWAQGARSEQPGAELARLQGERRILLKGGVVLTLDRQVGDFARADVLIENGKISTVRPDIATSGEATAVIDAENHILIPGFVDTHSHSIRASCAAS
jgi:5-methylthioadenosine/S-adenosylhomocysteine deaminase